MLRIGTSGFSFNDWIGTVYPPGIKQRDMLIYYEKDLGFNTLEINYTYYRLPQWKTSEAMARKTSENFCFIVKSYKEMTHEIGGEERLEQVFSDFLKGIEPFSDTGKLGAVLMQFPPAFYPSAVNFDYMLSCKGRLGDIPVVIEFRNPKWAKEETFRFLEKNDLGFCCVDEPKIPGLMPFVVRVTSSTGYFRFHGRNKRWFKTSAAERYNYLYSDSELTEFVPQVKKAAESVPATYAFFNNCHAGSAAKNAIRMKELLGLKESKEEKGGQLSLNGEVVP